MAAPRYRTTTASPQVTLFIDDLNMPALEEYGASPPVELLRQMIGQGGFYDRRALFWKTVQDVHVASACGPPEGGRNPVTGRLLRYFHLLQIPNLSEDSMRKIFSAILTGFFGNFHRDVQVPGTGVTEPVRRAGGWGGACLRGCMGGVGWVCVPLSGFPHVQVRARALYPHWRCGRGLQCWLGSSLTTGVFMPVRCAYAHGALRVECPSVACAYPMQCRFCSILAAHVHQPYSLPILTARTRGLTTISVSSAFRIW